MEISYLRRLVSFYSRSPGAVLNCLKYKLSGGNRVLNYSPLGLILWVTDRCNLNCDFCLRSKTAQICGYKHRLLLDMTLGAFKKIFELFPYAHSISFIGQGEPFLNKDIFTMMEYATRLRKAVSIVTNGTLIDRDAAVRIVRDRVFHINISLKAVSADKFASVTGSSGELFSKIIYGIRLLNEEKRKSKSGLKVELSYVLSRSRLSDMVEVIKLADALNVGYLLFNNYIPFGAFDKEGEKEVLFSDDKEINDAIAESAKLAKKVKVSWPPLMHRGSYSRYCPSAFKSLNIDAEGNITCCGRVLPPSSEYGNIFQDKSAWNSDYVARLRDNFLSPDKEIPDRCKLCVEMA